MQKIIIDTNVLVSSLIQKSFPHLILNLVIDRKVEVCLSNELLEEYYAVLRREKFSRYQDFYKNAEQLMVNLQQSCIYFKPSNKLEVISDKDDNKLMELAEVSSADFLVTGDVNDFTMSQFKETKIVTPKVYWENYRPMS
ncbi:MAG: putative toxin-antitoxin system toxin component, PIN family [Bacteroidota bacterium]|jgi:putative PIN family toxin of toxin-antitoxin system|nr:putative toxin-antitoxin system toxin component, PIN family [Cytophagales bacterium]MCE2957445.1 putative toxin-antitoxin system toxin component, PIN family [Flammeovirgaceae bacterium]MCZ8071427.1 putative toxin-antitoxin system toxin component, PIN family [Cytophagales bacterium]